MCDNDRYTETEYLRIIVIIGTSGSTALSGLPLVGVPNSSSAEFYRVLRVLRVLRVWREFGKYEAIFAVRTLFSRPRQTNRQKFQQRDGPADIIHDSK